MFMQKADGAKTLHHNSVLEYGFGLEHSITSLCVYVDRVSTSSQCNPQASSSTSGTLVARGESDLTGKTILRTQTYL